MATSFPRQEPGLGVYAPGAYRKEALVFLKQCIGEEQYNRFMCKEPHHYVAARILLDEMNWKRFVWIEQHGSLEHFPV